MVKEIKSGNDILSPSGLPNIKLVKTEQSEWILFDGHHSLLSYMIPENNTDNKINIEIKDNLNTSTPTQQQYRFHFLYQLEFSNYHHPYV